MGERRPEVCGPRRFVLGVSVAIRARGILPLLQCLEQAGHDPAAVLRDIGLAPAALEDKEATVPILALDAVWRRAEQLIGPTVSLDVAAMSDDSTFGSLTYLITRSATVGEALRRLVQHMSALSQGLRYSLNVADGVAQLRAELIGRRNPARPLHVFSLAVAHAYQRRFAGEPWRLRAVQMMCAPPDDTRPEAEFFGVQPRYAAPIDALEFDAELLGVAYGTPDDTLVEILEASVQHLDTAESSPPVAARCQAAIAHVVEQGAGPPDLQQAAEALGMTARTLRRHLQDDQTTFRQELDAVRARIARERLAHDSVEDVARRLGFADRRSFARAFERWTGMTPGRFAQLARADLKSEGPG